MRKLISCLLALTVVLSLLAVPAFASSATGSGKEVTVTLSGTAKPGENLCTVTVKVSGAPVAGIEFYIYPPSDWEETGSSTADAEKLFDLVNYSGNTFRATGVKSGMEVEGEWTALTLTYKMKTPAVEGQDIKATATVTVGPSGIYNAELQDHTPKMNGEFTVEITSVILGDANGTGYLDPDDASQIMRKIVGLTSTLDSEVSEDAGDANKTGYLDPDDASQVMRKIVGLPSTLD